MRPQVAEQRHGADGGREVDGVGEDGEQDGAVGAGVDEAQVAFQLHRGALNGFGVDPADDGEVVAALVTVVARGGDGGEGV